MKAGHLALHATRRIQSGLGTLSAIVERRKALEAEEKRQDLEGVRARIREKLAVLRERTIEELVRQNRPDPPVSEGPPVPPAPKAGLH